jgi:hypothetical protein
MTDNRDDRGDLWSKATSPFAPPSERERALAELAKAGEVDLGEPAEDDPTDTWAASPFAPTASRREKGAPASDTDTETWDRSTSPFAPPSERKRAAASEERDKQTASRSSRADAMNDDLMADQLIDLADTCSIGWGDLLESIDDPEKRRAVENAAVAWGRA